jgi:hypothetical protein
MLLMKIQIILVKVEQELILTNGKLHTRSKKKRGDVTRILELLCCFGATPDIL